MHPTNILINSKILLNNRESSDYISQESQYWKGIDFTTYVETPIIKTILRASE